MNKGDHRQRIGQLGGNVVHMAAMGTSRGHDGGVGDRGAVVTANGAGQAGRKNTQMFPLRWHGLDWTAQ